MTDDEIYAALRAQGWHVLAGDVQVFRAGYAVGLEAAAKVCEPRGEWKKLWQKRVTCTVNVACRDAIRALKGQG